MPFPRGLFSKGQAGMLIPVACIAPHGDERARRLMHGTARTEVAATTVAARSTPRAGDDRHRRGAHIVSLMLGWKAAPAQAPGGHAVVPGKVQA